MRLDKLKRVSKVYAGTGLPLRFYDSEIEDFKILGDSKKERDFNKKSLESFLEYYNNLEENMIEGKGLILCGSKGVGKTMLTTILSKRAIEIFLKWNKEIKAHYGNDVEKLNKLQFVQATQLIQLAFRSTCSPKELELAYNLKGFSGLFIDDITKIQSLKEDKEFSILDDLFRYRDLHQLPTWVTSQVDIAGLEKMLPGALFDLIKSNCKEIVFIGDSQRGDK